MERITLGKTGIDIVRMGFGGIPIQRVDEQQAIETVRHAVECGLDYIDTARAYTTSEERIGKALQLTDKSVVVSSKSQDRTADGIRAEIEASLKNLQRDFIELYQCHFVKDEADYQRILSKGGALEGLLRAKNEGLIGHIGITSHSLDLLDRVLDDDVFETIMVCFSFLEPTAKEQVIPKALQKKVGVIAMKSFSGGVLDDPVLALKYVLAQPGVVIIPGVETVDLFSANWQVFNDSYRLSAQQKAAIDEIRQRYDKMFCRRCDYCRPCSEDIPIQTIMGIRFAVKRFGEAFLETDWMRDALEKARRCAQCEECVDRCPYDLPIPELIKKNLEWLDHGRPEE
jgi:predicted aldo/keto reductase-like oxidoreductase